MASLHHRADVMCKLGSALWRHTAVLLRKQIKCIFGRKIIFVRQNGQPVARKFPAVVCRHGSKAVTSQPARGLFASTTSTAASWTSLRPHLSPDFGLYGAPPGVFSLKNFWKFLEFWIHDWNSGRLLTGFLIQDMSRKFNFHVLWCFHVMIQMADGRGRF